MMTMRLILTLAALCGGQSTPIEQAAPARASPARASPQQQPLNVQLHQRLTKYKKSHADTTDRNLQIRPYNWRQTATRPPLATRPPIPIPGVTRPPIPVPQESEVPTFTPTSTPSVVGGVTPVSVSVAPTTYTPSYSPTSLPTSGAAPLTDAPTTVAPVTVAPQSPFPTAGKDTETPTPEPTVITGAPTVLVTVANTPVASLRTMSPTATVTRPPIAEAGTTGSPTNMVSLLNPAMRSMAPTVPTTATPTTTVSLLNPVMESMAPTATSSPTVTTTSSPTRNSTAIVSGPIFGKALKFVKSSTKSSKSKSSKNGSSLSMQDETVSRPSGKSGKGIKSAKGVKSAKGSKSAKAVDVDGKSSKDSKKNVLAMNAVDRTTEITASGGWSCRESKSSSWGMMAVSSVMLMGYFSR